VANRPKTSGFNFHDHAGDPANSGEVQRNAERIKFHDGGQVQELVKSELAGVHPGLNRLRNPSFELDADETSPPTGWTNNGDGAEVDTGDKYEGSKSALILAASGQWANINQTIAAKKGQYIRASVACKATTAAHAYLVVNADGANKIIEIHTGTGGGAWEILSGVYGPMAADGNVVVSLSKETATATDIWFDQAVLEVLDVPSDEMRRQDSQLIQYTRTVLKTTVNYDDASPKALFNVQDGDIVLRIWVEVTTAWDGAAPGTVTLGDGNDADGFAINLAISPSAAGYKLFNHDNRGAYFYDPVNKHDVDKIYTGADTIDAFLVQNDSTQGVMDVYAEILRLK